MRMYACTLITYKSHSHTHTHPNRILCRALYFNNLFVGMNAIKIKDNMEDNKKKKSLYRRNIIAQLPNNLYNN